MGDARKFNGAVDTAVGKAGGLKGALGGIAGGAMGIIGPVGLAIGGIAGITAVLGDAKQAYQEDQASQALLGTALQNNIANWDGNLAVIEKVIEANMRLGFSDEEQRKSLALLVGETKNVAEAQTIQTAAMDLARLKGISLETATNALIKAHNGNYAALKAVGVEVKKGTKFTEALGQVQDIARGQAEAYAKTSEGQMVVSQNKVGEAMEKVGGAIDQVASVVMPLIADALVTAIGLFNDIWTAIQPVVKTILDALIPAVKLVASVIKTVVDTVGPIIKSLWDLAVDVVEGIIKGFQDIVTFFQGMPTAIGNAVKGMWDGIWEGFRGVINAVIDGWNGLQFRVPEVDLGPLGKVGGFTIGVPTIPRLHSGGIVPGAKGEDVLAMLQAGERVVPVNEANRSAAPIYLTFNVTAQDPEQFARDTLKSLRRELNRQGMSLA